MKRLRCENCHKHNDGTRTIHIQWQWPKNSNPSNEFSQNVIIFNKKSDYFILHLIWIFESFRIGCFNCINPQTFGWTDGNTLTRFAQNLPLISFIISSQTINSIFLYECLHGCRWFSPVAVRALFLPLAFFDDLRCVFFYTLLLLFGICSFDTEIIHVLLHSGNYFTNVEMR